MPNKSFAERHQDLSQLYNFFLALDEIEQNYGVSGDSTLQTKIHNDYPSTLPENKRANSNDDMISRFKLDSLKTLAVDSIEKAQNSLKTETSFGFIKSHRSTAVKKGK